MQEEIKLKARTKPKLTPNDLMPVQEVMCGKTKLVSLEESLRIQREQEERTKQLRLEVAARRLAERTENEKTSEEELKFDGMLEYRDVQEEAVNSEEDT